MEMHRSWERKEDWLGLLLLLATSPASGGKERKVLPKTDKPPMLPRQPGLMDRIMHIRDPARACSISTASPRLHMLRTTRK